MSANVETIDPAYSVFRSGNCICITTLVRGEWSIELPDQ